jgi:hypothetical protein
MFRPQRPYRWACESVRLTCAGLSKANSLRHGSAMTRVSDLAFDRASRMALAPALRAGGIQLRD